MSLLLLKSGLFYKRTEGSSTVFTETCIKQEVIDTIEQREVFEQLERLSIDTEAIKQAKFSHEVMKEILVIVKKSRRLKID